MENQAFWLADIGDHTTAVSYVGVENGVSRVVAVGPACPWDESNPMSFDIAIDQSMNESAIKANVTDDADPNFIALIIPPFWVGSDGKIVSEKKKILESMSKKLGLKLMGYICNDDAIVEAANIAEGFPASFVLVNIAHDEIIVSLTYLGRTIERVRKNIPGSFDPELLESAILEFKSESALPPQIILFGQVDDLIYEAIKNYSWIGKKNIETFLHLPDVKVYTQIEVTQIYFHAINSQFSPPPIIATPPIPSNPTIVETEAVIEDENEEIEPEAIENSIPSSKIELTEVLPMELGFSTEIQENNFSEVQNFTIPETFPEVQPVIAQNNFKPKIKFNFSFPKLKFPNTNFLLFPLVISPLLILIPFYFSTAHITLFLNPYEFKKTFSATFDSQAKNIDFTNKIIPINRDSFTINTSSSLPTTGKITQGEKAKGEIVIFNKQDKPQNISAGAVLLDSQGNRFTLDNNAQVPASSSNLDMGVITLGQVKVTVTASEIGPEYNLAKDTSIHFKDFAESLLIAKASQVFSGGTKQELSAVSAADKTQLQAKLTTAINDEVQKRIDQEIVKNPNIIPDTVQTIKGRVDFNREVGEKADQLTGVVVSTVYVFYLDPQKKLELLNNALSSEAGFSESVIDPAKFNLSINSTKNSIDKINGQLTISGSALPKTDSLIIAKKLSGKSQSKAISIIKNDIPRVYNYSLDTNFKFLKFINPIPFRVRNIFISFK